MGGDIAAALVRTHSSSDGGMLRVSPDSRASLFLTFTLTSVFVEIGVVIYRRWRRWRNTKVAGSTHDEMRAWRRRQFSIKSALAICTCVAVLSAIIVRIPLETWSATPAFVAAAIICGVISLLTAWIVRGKGTLRERSATAIAFPTVLLGFTAIAAAYSEAQLPLAPSVLDAFFSISKNQIALFFSIALGLFAALLLTLLLVSAVYPDSLQPAPGRKRRISMILVLIFWSVLIVAPPALMLIALLQPLPQVDNTLPSPNGYDELVRIGKQFQGSAIMKELAADVVDEAKLDAAVPKYQAQFAAIRKALDIHSRVPIQYDQIADIDTNASGNLRQLAHVLSAKADATLRAGNIDESLACRADTLHLSQSICSGGLLIHYLYASADEGTATDGIYRTIESMNSDQCRAVLRQLANYDQTREDFEGIRERELVWMTKTNGWPNRMGFLLDEMLAQGNVHMVESDVYRKDQAVLRLLLVEVALRAYQLDHGQLPAHLTELVPNYLSSLPDDPFATAPQPFHYRVTSSGFELWSVSLDGKDDNGAPLAKNEYGGTDLESRGDLRLDAYFAPDETASGQAAASADAAGNPNVPPAVESGNDSGEK